MKLVRKQSGFTLIEIVIVVVIISIIISMSTLYLSKGQSSQVKKKSRQFIALVEVAKENAIFNSQDYGISFSETGYSFYRLRGDQWLKIDDDRLFSTRRMPDGLALKLELEGIRVALGVEEKKKPQVFITSDGEMSAFTLAIEDRSDYRYEMEFDVTGEYTLITDAS